VVEDPVQYLLVFSARPTHYKQKTLWYYSCFDNNIYLTQARKEWNVTSYHKRNSKKSFFTNFVVLAEAEIINSQVFAFPRPALFSCTAQQLCFEKLIDALFWKISTLLKTNNSVSINVFLRLTSSVPANVNNVRIQKRILKNLKPISVQWYPYIGRQRTLFLVFQCTDTFGLKLLYPPNEHIVISWVWLLDRTLPVVRWNFVRWSWIGTATWQRQMT